MGDGRWEIGEEEGEGRRNRVGYEDKVGHEG